MIKNKIINELNRIPDYKLAEIYDFVHYYRLGLQQSVENIDKIMEFAGCWNDMPERVFDEFISDIVKRRKQAFSGRRSGEKSIG